MKDEKDENIEWLVSLLDNQTRFQQLAPLTQRSLKISIGQALVGVTSSAFAATRSLVQLKKGARLENEAWNIYSIEADSHEKGSFMNWFHSALGLISFCGITICYIEPETNDPAYVLQALGESGSKLREWHG